MTHPPRRRSGQPTPTATQDMERVPLFQSAAQTLRRNIEAGTLLPGLVLLEGPLSEKLRVSRTSIRRALQLLESDGLVRRFEGRGFLVADGTEEPSPVRRDLRGIDLDQSSAPPQVTALSRVHDAVERDILDCLVFGQYRITETDLAKCFEVSRTVVRDVLGRLQERGLVTKSSTSRWTTARLTARSIKEKFDLQRVLEVAALHSVEATLDPMALDGLHGRMEVAENGSNLVSATEWFRLASDFRDVVPLSTPNRELRSLIERNYRTLGAFQAVLFQLGLSGDRYSIRELRMVIELLKVGAIGGAAEMHGIHLTKSCARTIAQLKIVSVLPEPDHLAPYLVPLTA